YRSGKRRQQVQPPALAIRKGGIASHCHSSASVPKKVISTSIPKKPFIACALCVAMIFTSRRRRVRVMASKSIPIPTCYGDETHRLDALEFHGRAVSSANVAVEHENTARGRKNEKAIGRGQQLRDEVDSGTFGKHAMPGPAVIDALVHDAEGGCKVHA